MIVAFIDAVRAEGHAGESICRVLSEQGCQVAARNYCSWSQPGRPVAGRTISDATVLDTVRELAWNTGEHGRRLAPEGLYERRKMTVLVRRSLPDATPGAVDRAMRTLGLQGIRRSRGVRTTTPATNGRRAGDLLDRTSARRRRTAPGSPPSPTCAFGSGSTTSPSSSTASPRRSSPGTRRQPRTPTW